MPAAAFCASPHTALYRRRQPERTLLCTVQTNLAPWLELSCDTRQGGSAPEVAEEPIPCRAARFAWALLLARIYVRRFTSVLKSIIGCSRRRATGVGRGYALRHVAEILSSGAGEKSDPGRHPGEAIVADDDIRTQLHKNADCVPAERGDIGDPVARHYAVGGASQANAIGTAGTLRRDFGHHIVEHLRPQTICQDAQSVGVGPTKQNQRRAAGIDHLIVADDIATSLHPKARVGVAINAQAVENMAAGAGPTSGIVLQEHALIEGANSAVLNGDAVLIKRVDANSLCSQTTGPAAEPVTVEVDDHKLCLDIDGIAAAHGCVQITG